MPDITIDTILERWRADMASADYSRTKSAGDAFERLSIAFLTHDPEQRLQYRNVRHFADWASESDKDATDTGIDLVAELASGEGLAAVQCKCYAEGKPSRNRRSTPSWRRPAPGISASASSSTAPGSTGPPISRRPSPVRPSRRAHRAA